MELHERPIRQQQEPQSGHSPGADRSRLRRVVDRLGHVGAQALKLPSILGIFLAVYLFDYWLTLKGTTRQGFRELNPMAPYWNFGAGHTVGLALKLAVAGLIMFSAMAAAQHGHKEHAERYLRWATVAFIFVDALGLVAMV